MLTINSYGVEISIAGCIKEMVREHPNPRPFCFIFSLFFIMCLVLTTYGDKDYVQC